MANAIVCKLVLLSWFLMIHSPFFDSYSILSCFLIFVVFFFKESMLSGGLFFFVLPRVSWFILFWCAFCSDICPKSKIYFLFIKGLLFPRGVNLLSSFCPFFLVLFDNSFKGNNILFNAIESITEYIPLI